MVDLVIKPDGLGTHYPLRTTELLLNVMRRTQEFHISAYCNSTSDSIYSLSVLLWFNVLPHTIPYQSCHITRNVFNSLWTIACNWTMMCLPVEWTHRGFADLFCFKGTCKYRNHFYGKGQCIPTNMSVFVFCVCLYAAPQYLNWFNWIK